MSWGQLIWVFFPIPCVSLFLLSIPGPRALEKLGNNLVHKLFFTKVSFGAFYIRLFHLFFMISLLIFANTVQKINVGIEGFHCQSCRYETEIYWYKKAMKFRTERNFWLALFNVILWYLVARIHQLKGTVIRMKDTIRELESESKKVKVEVSLPKSDTLKKEE